MDHIKTIAPLPWEVDAACSQIGDDLWFPYHYDANSVELPVSICNECPVKEQCLDRAMEAEGSVSRWHRHGIFGGLLPAERAALAQDYPDGHEERRHPVVRVERPTNEGQGLPAADIRHGTRNGYSYYGCRCGLCTNAAVETVRKNRSRKKDGLPPGDPRHGTANGYENKGCRCDACKEAVRIKRAERRRAVKEAA